MVQAIKDVCAKRKAEKLALGLTHQGLDMDALKSIASLNEKYIKIRLRDGTLIEVWRDSDVKKDEPDRRYW